MIPFTTTPLLLTPYRLLLLVVCQGVVPCARAAFAGPYYVKFQDMGNCPKDGAANENCDMCLSTVKRYNHTAKTHVFDVNMTISQGMFYRGKSEMVLDVAKWDSVSGWREHFLVMRLGEVCFLYEEIATDFVKMLIEKYGAPTSCPVADGVYGGRNMVATTEAMRHFPALPYGRFRVHAIVEHMQKALRKANGPRGCLRIVVDVLPRLPKATAP